MDLLNLTFWQRALLGTMLALRRFPMICAWCKGELEPRWTVVGWSKASDSHGICPDHLIEWLVVTDTD